MSEYEIRGSSPFAHLGLCTLQLLFHALLGLLLFLQHLPQVVLLVLQLPQLGGQGQLLSGLLC